MAVIKFLVRRSICAGLIFMGLSASGLAAQPLGTGLGQAWPNAQDLSASTHWHVYVFANNGIRYVQVNDLNGSVRVAFAAANGQFLVLPMGLDSQRLATPQQPLSTSDGVTALTSYTETVYRDDTVQLTAVPLSDGTTMFTATASTTTTALAPCDNPLDCSGHVN